MMIETKSLLKVVIDPGSSGVKVFYWFEGSNRVFYLFLPSEYIVLPSSSADELPKNSGLGRIEDSSWIRYQKSGECHLIGRTALDFNVKFNFKMLKIDYIVAKAAAILGIIAEKHAIGSEFSVALGILLPLDEIINTSTKEALKTKLKKTLKSFYYRDCRLSVQVESDDLKLVPEGYGFAMYDAQFSSDFCFKNSGYLVCGQKHNSFLYFPDGRLSVKDSSSDPRGFVDFADLVCQKVPGLKRDTLLSIFNTDVTFNFRQPSRISGFKTSLNFSRLTCDPRLADSIESAYHDSLPQYWASFSSWLDDILPPLVKLHSLTRLGGYSELISHLLNTHFAPTTVYVPYGINDKLMNALGFSRDLNSKEARRFISLNPVRFADAWGFFAIFSGYLASIEQKSSISIARSSN